MMRDVITLPDLPDRGPVVLQHHGGKRDGKWTSPPSLVQFRNIQIKELPAEGKVASAAERK